MLDAHVLVLNKSWVAVNIATARRALSLLFQGQARVVHSDDYMLYDFDDWCALSSLETNGHRYIHTPRLKVRLPEVIILGVFNGFIRQEVRFSRRNILARDNNQCQYCGGHPPRQNLSIDHVVPRSRGGKDTWDNLVVACMKCNVSKGSRTPNEAKMKLLKKPKKPLWLPRFGRPIEEDDINRWQRFLETVPRVV
jgi:5-methylcytosine-specific restriction endonuclease McrA